MDVAVEFTSLSKTYSMPGWRMGFAVGNERLVAALARVKSYLDYGAFTPIQVAASAALNGPQDCVEEMRQTYKRRRDCLVEIPDRAGWDIPSPPGTMFAWAPLPEGMEQIGSLEFSKLLLEKAGVAVSPGVGFRRVRGRICPHCAGRERAPHPAGRARDQEVPLLGGCATSTTSYPLHKARPASGRYRGEHHESEKTAAVRYSRAWNRRFRPNVAAGGSMARRLRRSAAGRFQLRASAPARAARNAGTDLSGVPWFEDPSALAVAGRYRRVCRADGRRQRTCA